MRGLAVASRYRAFAFACCVALLSACRKPRVRDESRSERAVEAGTFIAATKRACRVMALRGRAYVAPHFSVGTLEEGERAAAGDGDASAGGSRRRSLERGDLLPEGWLVELEADTELTVQATVSTREITLVGPARAEACPEGDESVRLSYGKVTAVPGAGVRPGADVWVATPLGVVRFSDAKIAIAVSDDEANRLQIDVISSRASYVPAPGMVQAASPDRHDAAGVALLAGEAISLVPGPAFAARRREGAASRWVGELVAACARRADVARAAAELMREPGDAGRATLGDLAFAHVSARQAARAACESAWAAGALGAGLDATRRADLARADASWKGTVALPPRP